MTDYQLEYHPTAKGIPVGIWEMTDGRLTRCVAVLKGDASATMREARINDRGVEY